MQKLLLPVKNMMLTAGYQNQAYQNHFGFMHFGHDSISTTKDRQVYASGNGRVLDAGTDNLLGNVLIILYPQSYEPKSADLVLRYCHLDRFAVKAGDNVATGQLLGVYGNTGRYSTAAHLHVEADLDTLFFAYSATVNKSGSVIKAGNSKSMLNPSAVLFIAPTQTFAASKAQYGGIAYVSSDDLPKKL